MTRCCRTLALGVVLFGLCLPRGAQAHPLDTASLSLRELEAGRFLVHFQAGSAALVRQLGAPAVFPAPCHLDGASLDCGAAGLSGTLEFPWLEGTLTRLMVDIEWRDGSRVLRVVTASAPTLGVYGGAATGLRALVPIVLDYTRLGVEHILTGFDHLCFVLALTLLVERRRQLVATITAFTLAHSITLGATALGAIELASAPVEVMIALSIVLVCVECLRPAESLTRRAPWLVAFTFGLLHGMGFASALLEVGLPEQHLPSALFSFNLGVELGQLAVIAAALALGALLRRARWRRAWQRGALVYALGGVAAFWVIDRVVVMLQSY
ncbi:MAG TPA: HupE/UreJ family protein [Polyangiaceae bacterium]|nr:HupE/UreJ family protein [Polyangiaceae bacterium]